jgi:hypothetical protein
LQLTPEADSRASMERHETRANLGQLRVLPTRRVESGSVGAVDVGASVHVVDRVADAYAAGYEDRGLAVRAATTGEHGCFGGDVDVDGELLV